MKKTVLYFLMLMMSLLSACAYTSKITDKLMPNAELNALVVRGDTAMEEYRFAKAIEAYDEAVSIKPDDLDLRLKQAKAYQYDGKLAQAYNFYQIIIDSKPQSNPRYSQIVKTAKANQAKFGFKSESVIAQPAVDNKKLITKYDQSSKAHEDLSDLDILSEPILINKSEPDMEVKLPIKIEVPLSAEPALVKVPAKVEQVSSETSKNIMPTDINFALNRWKSAWEEKRVGAYFDSYVRTFSGDLVRPKNWRDDRKKKILTAKTIKVVLSDIQPLSVEDGVVKFTFIQHYQSAQYKDQVGKTMKMKKINGRWLIVQETSKAL